MLLLVGAVPIKDLPLSLGRIEPVRGGIGINGRVLALDRGTSTMMSVVCTICQEFGLEMPMALVAGDMGTRDGSMKIYDYLSDNLSEMDVSVMTFHYMMPDMKKNKEVLKRIEALEKRPILIADAGSMYVAKAGGQATAYDVFTPDVGEVAYLADEKAAHPTYTRGFIFHMEDDVPELIRRAYEGENAPHTLFVKGHVDYICQDGRILETVSQPCIEEMEPIGGTGDMITGTISALIYAGKSPLEACRIAARVNRRAGELSQPTPATQVVDIVKHIPGALKAVLETLK